MNLEALRRKRIKRLGVRSKGYDGQRRIFSILNRATEKFHGDVGLWILYVDYARKQKSYKKTGEVMTKMLRMHPNQAKLWIYAAKYALEEKGDMMEARGLLQRGLRFCEWNEELWLQYGKLEMMFIAKLAGRRRVLGLDKAATVEETDDDGQAGLTDDIMALPSISAEEFNTQKESHMPAKSSDDFKEERILSGALPITVFDAAMRQFDNEPKLAIQYFDMVAEFDGLTCRQALLNHVMEGLHSQKHKTSAIMIRYIKLPTTGITTSDSSFPPALGASLTRMQEISAANLAQSIQADLHLQILEWLVQYLTDSELDQDLRQVMVITMPKVFRLFQAAPSSQSDVNRKRLTAVLTILDEVGLKDLSESGWSWAQQVWPSVVGERPCRE